jgi:hypothetical protein
MVLGSTQPLTEVSTNNPLGGNGSRRVRLENSRPSAGTLYKHVEPQHLLKFGPSRSVTGTILHFTYAHQTPIFCPLCSHATSNVFQFQFQFGLHLVHSHTYEKVPCGGEEIYLPISADVNVFSRRVYTTHLIKLISSLLSQRKFRISLEGEMSTPRYSETCIRRNRMGPKIFSTLDKFPHYTK